MTKYVILSQEVEHIENDQIGKTFDENVLACFVFFLNVFIEVSIEKITKVKG